MKTSELPKIESMSSHDEILRKRCERQNEGEEGGGEWRLWANRIIVRRRQKLTFYNALILASLSHVKLLSFEAFAAFIPSVDAQSRGYKKFNL